MGERIRGVGIVGEKGSRNGVSSEAEQKKYGLESLDMSVGVHRKRSGLEKGRAWIERKKTGRGKGGSSALPFKDKEVGTIERRSTSKKREKPGGKGVPMMNI